MRTLLLWVLQHLNPKSVVAIGRDAKMALDGAGVQAMAVRHPSYGGQNDFIRDISAVYRLPPSGDSNEAQNLMLL